MVHQANATGATMNYTTRNQLMKLGDVTRITTLSPASIWRKIAKGTFPKPVHLSANRRAWRSSEVEVWLENPMDWPREPWDDLPFEDQ